ncbi:MAG: hypothetical protein IKZ13_07990 [Akkermansia sp.]|nr:hypothetical protein [Akkermansia sp.]
MKIKSEKAILASASEGRRRLLELFDTPLGQQVLKDLEEHFETEVAAFQEMMGAHDPMGAVRREAYREVFLVIRTRLAMARREAELEAKAAKEAQKKKPKE